MINVTDDASIEIQSLLTKQEKEGCHLRIGVEGGGCSGLEYYMGFDDQIRDDDEVLELSGFKLVVDQSSLPHLDGSTLDYSHDLMNSGFVFNNPNATKTCGCGKSFCG